MAIARHRCFFLRAARPQPAQTKRGRATSRMYLAGLRGRYFLRWPSVFAIVPDYNQFNMRHTELAVTGADFWKTPALERR